MKGQGDLRPDLVTERHRLPYTDLHCHTTRVQIRRTGEYYVVFSLYRGIGDRQRRKIRLESSFCTPRLGLVGVQAVLGRYVDLVGLVLVGYLGTRTSMYRRQFVRRL